jgi:SAM-dependent methyltransferase
MFNSILAHAQDTDARLNELRERLGRFYADNVAYYEDAEGDKTFIYLAILELLKQKRRAKSSPLKVLEIGAGRTTFPLFIRHHGFADQVDFVAHDINRTNLPYYQEHQIPSVIGGWTAIGGCGPVDLCFSTYVYEHLVEPHKYLKGVAQILAADGSIAVICPKYVFPGYVPPALRWLPWWHRHLLTGFLAASNLWAGLVRKPNFWICVEPAVFKSAWRRDNDAVHMVSTADLKAGLGRAFKVRPLQLQYAGAKHRLINKLILMSIVAHRRSSTTPPGS